MSSSTILAVSRARFFGATGDTRATYAVPLLLILIAAAAARLLFLPGPSGGDDVVYSIRALELARGLWDHVDPLIDFRFGVTLPMSLFARVFPDSELALSGWALLCSLIEIAIVFVAAHHLWGLRAAVAGAVLLAFTPIHISLGALPIADAPLAAMFSIAFGAAFLAMRTGRTAFYVTAGLAAGFSWWIKPVAFGPFIVALTVYIALGRDWRRQWLLAGIACAGVILLEWIVLWVHFNDPFISLRGNFAGVVKHYVQLNAPWGSHSPWFYFQQLWLDGRDMWIVPHLALVGLAILGIRAWRRAGWDSGRLFACCWFLGLLFSFSFFVYSIDPIKIIPKQQNYALIFAAPAALLAGYGVSLLPRSVRVLAILVTVVGGVFLAAIDQQAIRNTASRIVQTIELASMRPDQQMFASRHVINMARLRAELSSTSIAPTNIIPLTELATRSATEQPRGLVVIEPFAPESRLPMYAQPIRKLIDACGSHVGSLESRSGGGAGRPFVAAIAHLREVLPSSIERHLRFTTPATNPPPTIVYSMNDKCS